MKETSDDMVTLARHFGQTGRCDHARIGVAGVSMGGFAAFRAVVIEPAIKVAAPVISSPYWDELPGEVPCLDDPDSWQALRAYADRHSPALQIEQFYPRPLLIQIGALDRHYNGQRVKRFCQELQGYYAAAPETLKCIEHQGVAHEFTPAMWDNALEWFRQYL